MEAVIISLAKAHHQNHTSIVYCLKLKHRRDLGETRPYGHPFRLHADGNKFIITNSFLRDEGIDVGKVILISSSGRYLSNTGDHLDIGKIIQDIKFDDPRSAVAFRGIEEAFPNATIYDSALCQDSPGHALISVLEIFLKDNSLAVLTRLEEEISICNRSRSEHQNSSIQNMKLSVKKPTSEEDVGSLILISFGSRPNEQGVYWGTCEGILLGDVVSTESKHYKMDSCPRGYCVIINNMSFEEEELNRQCAIHDEQKLQALFENDLHFLVHIENDLQNFQMEDICTEYSRKDHSKFDAFVCIVMTHGDTGDQLIGVKGRKIGIEELMSKFKPNRCPSLANKPKLFFIQSCRGSAEDEFLTQSKDSRDYIAGLNSDSTLARCSSSCPQESDFLLAWATVPGYVAYKRPNYGSFYIQVLTDVIQRNHKKEHLEDMLLEVNHSVSGNCSQVAMKQGTLRAKVFL